MGQTASQIENHIEDKRETLGQNLRELEYKVKSAADWRHQFEQHPGAFLGAAFGGGLLLAAAFGRSSGGRHRHYNYSFPGSAATPGESSRVARTPRVTSPAMDGAIRTWENVKGAMIGVAAARLKDYVDGVIPGFSAHYHQVEVKHPT
jgi:hypothetical protein